jgi:hypothetical protein
LNELYKGVSSRSRESFIGIVSAGFFFVLVGALFITTPTLFDSIVSFFRNFDFTRIPNTEIYFFAPLNPRAHVTVYRAAETYSFVWGLFQIVVLAVRFIVRSPVAKKAETASNIVGWLGTGYLINMYLTGTTTLTVWFVFWAMVITLIGFSLIIRAIILAVAAAMPTTSMPTT